MSSRTWIYISILVVVLAAGGVFFWWMYKTSKITPKAEVTPTPTPTTFSDVPANYWAFTQIEAVNKAGYMIGYDIKAFKPDEQVDRATLAVVISRVYNKSYDNPTPSFSDVSKTYWAYKEIEGLKQAGWVNGFGDTTFRPDEKATLADLAALFARAHTNNQVPVVDPSLPSIYPDVPTSYWAYNEIIFVSNHDPYIMRGDGTGKFSPDLVATRGTLAMTTQKDQQLDTGNPPATPTYSDVPADNPWYSFVEAVTKAGYMQGYPAYKSFKPDDIADRASVAVAIARAVAGSDSAVPAGPATPSYSDVPTNYWAYRHIEYLKTKNIMQGYDNGTFRPDQAISASDGLAVRFTIAVVLARAKSLDLSSPPATASFADVTTTYHSFKEIEAVYKAGYTAGCRQDASGIYFCPDDPLTRATLAVFTYNAYLKTTPNSPTVISPAVSPVVSPKTPTPTPTVTVTVTSTPTPSTTLGASPTPTETTTTTTTTKPAKTGAEVPLAGAGLLSVLALARYLVGKRLK